MSKKKKYVGIKLRTDLRQAPFHVLKNWIQRGPKTIPTIIERGWNGYAKEDTWDLGHYLATWLPSAIRHLRDTSHGHPCEMEDMIESPSYEGEYDITLDYAAILWANILTDIADGFESFTYITNSEYLDEYEEVPSPIFEDWETDPFIEWLHSHRAEIDAKIAEKWAIYENGMSLFAEFFPNLWD